jgi:cell division protein FtsI (penicillin-binding protein 3)
VNRKDNLRINYIYLFFIFLFFLLALRITYLQVFRKNFFQNLAQSQYYRLIPLSGKRGSVFDCKGRLLATEINTHSVFADPAFIDDIDHTAQILALNLDLPKDILKEKLSKKKRFVWIKRKIPWDEKEKIKALNLKGIGFLREHKRFYPQENLASTLLGITDIDNNGLDGLELFYNKYLSGKDGIVRVLQDSASRELILTPEIISPHEGEDITLTIDSQIQYWVETYLEETIKKFGAKEGSVIVMNAATGEIMALANYPNFNPNNIKNISSDLMRNKAVCDMFEPGSVFKVVTLVASIDQNKFRDTDQIFCENGSFKIPGSILHDWRPYGTLTFREVFKKSSNIGVAKIANSMGKHKIYYYVKKMGFGEKTGIDVPGEVSGSLKAENTWSNTSTYIIPIGQEIGVNLVQLMRAFGIIANGGYLVRPHVVKDIYSQNYYKDFPIQKQRVISSSTAERAKSILIDVVSDGTGKLASIPGIKIGGKTGTAQKYDPVIRRYSPTQYRASFIGFISDLDPPIVIGISIFEPKKSHFGGVVAAPLFKKVAQMSIKYLSPARDITVKAEDNAENIND